MNALLRVFLVDDEDFARMRLERLVAECPSPKAEVVGQAGDVAQAVLWLRTHRCDVVLLDIQMPGADGLQLAAHLRAQAAASASASASASAPELPPAVVFVTAHARHAVRAFDLEATDYLTKPVRRERLQQALARVAARMASAAASSPREAGVAVPGAGGGGAAAAAGAAGGVGVGGSGGGGGGGSVPEFAAVTAVAPALPPAPSSPLRDEPALVVSERGRVVRILLADVLYLKAELKYVTLRTAAHSYVLDDALSDLEQRLGDRFLRIHRNALVARRAVSRLERRAASGDGIEWAVLVDSVGEWLGVSRRQVAAVREAIALRGV